MIIIKDQQTAMRPLGQLEDPEGNIISIYSRDPYTIACAVQRAIGYVPIPPTLHGGGMLRIANTDKNGQSEFYFYALSPDDRDKDRVALYKAKLLKWNTRAAAIREIASKL